MRTVKRSVLSFASPRSFAPTRATQAVTGPTIRTIMATRKNDSKNRPCKTASLP